MIGLPVRGSQRRKEEVVRQPAPIRGIDNRISLSSNDPSVCIYTYNLIPSEYGMQLRKGYQEHAIDLDNGSGTGVNTIIPFEGNTEGPADDRLFAVTNEGIWDVTIKGAVPVLKTDPADWSLISDDAGWGTYCHYIDDADNEFLLYADTINGLFEYSAATDQWARATGIIGPVIENINFVVVHKLRIWFGEENSTKVWYLPIKSRKGDASPLSIGSKFKHGGSLVGIYNWTVDGGDGVDDYLVFISSAGDVLPYRGSDPTQGDWSLVGTYFVGAVASGGRCIQQDGGNMNILSNYGITSMSDLLRGVDPRLPNEDSIGARVTELIRRDMRQYRNEFGWDVKTLSPEGAIAVITPKRLDGTYLQYIYNKAVNGWGLWRDLPLRCCDVWENSVRFGSEDGKVYTMDVSKDNITLIPPETGLNGVPIKFSILFNYNDMGQPGIFKEGIMARPDFLSLENPSYDVKFLYDYDVSEILTTPIASSTAASTWDFSNWDQAVWSSSTSINYNKVIGGTGRGRYVSIAIKGNGVGDTQLLSADIMFQTTGVL